MPRTTAQPSEWPSITLHQHKKHLNGFRLCSQLNRQQPLTIHLWMSPIFAWRTRKKYKKWHALLQRWMINSPPDVFDYKPLKSNEGSLHSIASIIVWKHKFPLKVQRRTGPALPSQQQITFCEHWQRTVDTYGVTLFSRFHLNLQIISRHFGRLHL